MLEAESAAHAAANFKSEPDADASVMCIDARCQMPDARCQMQDARCKMQHVNINVDSETQSSELRLADSNLNCNLQLAT